jgi:hypothetical protein
MIPSRGGALPWRGRQPRSRRNVAIFLVASLACIYLAFALRYVNRRTSFSFILQRAGEVQVSRVKCTVLNAHILS